MTWEPLVCIDSDTDLKPNSNEAVAPSCARTDEIAAYCMHAILCAKGLESDTWADGVNVMTRRLFAAICSATRCTAPLVQSAHDMMSVVNIDRGRRHCVSARNLNMCTRCNVLYGAVINARGTTFHNVQGHDDRSGILDACTSGLPTSQ